MIINTQKKDKTRTPLVQKSEQHVKNELLTWRQSSTQYQHYNQTILLCLKKLEQQI
jgi:hypothetical protein